MGKILMVGIPMMGACFPQIGIAQQLIRHGHSVDFVNSTVIKDSVNEIGAGLIAYENYGDKKYEPKYEKYLYEQAYNAANKVLRNYDLLIYDSWFFCGNALANANQVKSVRLSSMFAMNANVIKDFWDSNHAWGLYKIPTYRSIMTKRFARSVPIINKTNFWQEIIESKPLLDIVFTDASFQVRAEEFGERTKFVGPIIYDRKSDVKIPFGEMEKEMVYVAIGSISKNRKIIKTCMETFKDQNVSVIIALGNSDIRLKKRDIPSNVYVYRSVPQLEVLRRASLFISHGGMNSVNEALYYGVPVIICPQFADHMVIGKKVEELKLGVTIPEKQFCKESIENALSLIRERMEYNKKMSEKMKCLDGLSVAVKYIEDSMYCEETTI